MKTIRRIAEDIKGRSGMEKVFIAAIMLFIIYEMVMLCYLNLTQLPSHMGYDASVSYLMTSEMYKQKTLFLDNWVYTTTLCIDFPVPLAAVFMPLFHDVFVSHGVANLIAIFLIILMLAKLMDKIEMSLTVKLLAIAFVLCPYVNDELANINDLGYVSCVLTSASYYSIELFISFLIIYCFLSLDKYRKLHLRMTGICVLTEGLVFVSAVSSGFRLGITVIAPLMVYGVISLFTENRIKHLWDKDMIFLYISLAFTIAGKFFTERILHFQTREDIMTLVGLDTFWENLGSIFLGYFKLLGGMKSDTSVVALSTQGIKYLSRFAIAAAVLILFVVCLYEHIKKHSDNKGIYSLSCIVIFHVIMYSVLYTTYGSAVFEIRYLILPYLGMLLCGLKWIDQLDRKLILKWTGMALMFGCVFIVSVTSFRIYRNTTIDVEEMQELKENVEQIDSPVVYLIGDEILCRNMRAFDTDKVYKYFQVTDGILTQIRHWGDYTYYDLYAECPGKVIVVIKHDMYPAIPSEIQEQLQLYQDMDNVSIYYLEENLLGTK